MEHLPQPLGALLIEGSTGAQRARGARLQSIQAPLVEGVDGICDRLGATSQTPSDLGRALSARTRQKYLASPQNKGVIGAQPGAESLALLFRKRTFEDWRFHEDYHSSYHTINPDDALASRCRGQGFRIDYCCPTAAKARCSMILGSSLFIGFAGKIESRRGDSNRLPLLQLRVIGQALRGFVRV
jgi:hypothetical protein